MSKNLLTSIIITILLMNVPLFSQETTQTLIQISQMRLGINFGTSYFQHMRLDLKNFNDDIIATSDYLVPTQFKADFYYDFNPNFAIRFSSGYSFAQQNNRNEIDFGQLDSMDVKLYDNAHFSVAGFPIETAIIFRTALDKNQNILVHAGLGLGYYSYNYRSEGSYEEAYSESNQTKWEENYQNPDITLSGWAQFFTVGFNLNLGRSIGASFELSKIGLSFLHLKRDVVKQFVYAHEVEYKIRYGYQKNDYKTKNGFEDLAISVGIYWKL